MKIKIIKQCVHTCSFKQHKHIFWIIYLYNIGYDNYHLFFYFNLVCVKEN